MLCSLLHPAVSHEKEWARDRLLTGGGKEVGECKHFQFIGCYRIALRGAAGNGGYHLLLPYNFKTSAKLKKRGYNGGAICHVLPARTKRETPLSLPPPAFLRRSNVLRLRYASIRLHTRLSYIVDTLFFFFLCLAIP